MARQDETDSHDKRPDEFSLIETLFAPLATDKRITDGLRDDAALYAPSSGHEAVLTVDAMVAGVHFLPDDPPASVAKKLLRVNLSDLAAKGAVPKGYLLVTAWTSDLSFQWMKEFAAGLAEDQMQYDVSLWGGDTVHTQGPLTLSLTAIGEVQKGSIIRRGGGAAGHDLYVTGTIGDAALGLKLLTKELSFDNKEEVAFLTGRYREPQPRVAFGKRLAAFASASLDVSDGLLADLQHLYQASGVGARIELENVPLSTAAAEAVRRGDVSFDTLISGGDDYEILFAAPSEKRDLVKAVAAESGTDVTRIGTLTNGPLRVMVVNREGREVLFERKGYRHF